MRNPNGIHYQDWPETCHEPGHVHGCPGAAGGDHELDDAPEPVIDSPEFVDHPANARWDRG